MNFQWLFNRPIAHRGLHNDELPENSIPAYQNAIDHNYNIEIDVHVTKDGHVVVFHDANLKRVCGVDRFIKDCTLEELKTYRLKSTEYTIPTFREFLDLIDGKVGVLCEIKGINFLDHKIVKATLKELEGYKGNIALQSFNFGAVKYARKHSSLPAGELCTWASPDNKKKRFMPVDFMGKLWVCKISHPQFIAYNVESCGKEFPENKWLKKWSKKVPVIMWTINSSEKIEIAKEYASNIIFENMPLDEIEGCVGKLAPILCPIEVITDGKE